MKENFDFQKMAASTKNVVHVEEYIPFEDDDGICNPVVVETDVISHTLYTDLSSAHDEMHHLWHFNDEEQSLMRKTGEDYHDYVDDKCNSLLEVTNNNQSISEHGEPTPALLQKMRNASKCKTSILLPVSEVPTQKPLVVTGGSSKTSVSPPSNQKNTNPALIANNVVSLSDKPKLNIQAYKREHDYCRNPSAMYKRSRGVSECETFGNNNEREDNRDLRSNDSNQQQEEGQEQRMRTISTSSTAASCTSNCSRCSDHSNSSSSSSSDNESSSSSYTSSSDSDSEHDGRSWLPAAATHRADKEGRRVRRERRDQRRHQLDKYRSSESPPPPVRGRSRYDDSERSPTSSCRSSSRVTEEVRSAAAAARDEERRQEVRDAMDKRRVLFVGDLRTGTSRRELHRRFRKFGEIEKITMHERADHTHYGFITFMYRCDAFRAKEEGNDNLLPSEPVYSLNFGGRRFFCDDQYEDLDDKVEDDSSCYDYSYDKAYDDHMNNPAHSSTVQYSGYGSTFGCSAETDFDALLKAAKSSAVTKKR